MDAQEYGSLAHRTHLYWVGIHGADVQFHVQSMLDVMRIPVIGNLDWYLLNPACRQVDVPDKSLDPEKQARSECKNTHLDLYCKAGLSWPPERKHSDDFRVRHLTNRAFEVIYYCHERYPYAEAPLPGGEYPAQYLDINPTLDRITGNGGTRSPWGSTLNTLTCHSQMMVRRAAQREIAPDVMDLGVSVFQLDGVELMQIIGFDLSMYEDSKALPSHSLGNHMAGNAFSGFAALAVFSAALGALGIVASSPGTPSECADTGLHQSLSEDASAM